MAYFANSSEDTLIEQCLDCPLGAGWNNPAQKRLFDLEPTLKPCPAALIQSLYNYDQLKEGNKQLREAMNLLVNDCGVCEVRKLLMDCRREESAVTA